MDFSNLGEIKKTGVSKDEIKKIGSVIASIPKDFTPHPSIRKIYEARQKAIETGEGIDFALA